MPAETILLSPPSPKKKDMTESCIWVLGDADRRETSGESYLEHGFSSGPQNNTFWLHRAWSKEDQSWGGKREAPTAAARLSFPPLLGSLWHAPGDPLPFTWLLASLLIHILFRSIQHEVLKSLRGGTSDHRAQAFYSLDPGTLGSILSP